MGRVSLNTASLSSSGDGLARLAKKKGKTMGEWRYILQQQWARTAKGGSNEPKSVLPPVLLCIPCGRFYSYQRDYKKHSCKCGGILTKITKHQFVGSFPSLKEGY